SRAETNVLTPEAKIEWAKKELVKELDKELSKMRARSVEIDRAVLLEGQTLPSLRDNDSVFRISGFRSGALAHLLRIGYLMGWMAPLRHLSAKLLSDSSEWEPSMGEITTIGLDLAKHVFQVHGVDAEGATVLRKQLRRAQVLAFFSRLPPCLVG